MAQQRATVGPTPRILRTVRPGAPGTMGLLEEYGERLVCVRYRYDESAGRCYTTAEIVVREAEWAPPVRGPSPDHAVWVKVAWGERDLALRVRASGGKWNKERKLWELTWEKVGQLGLEDRVVGRVGF